MSAPSTAPGPSPDQASPFICLDGPISFQASSAASCLNGRDDRRGGRAACRDREIVMRRAHDRASALGLAALIPRLRSLRERKLGRHAIPARHRLPLRSALIDRKNLPRAKVPIRAPLDGQADGRRPLRGERLALLNQARNRLRHSSVLRSPPSGRRREMNCGLDQRRAVGICG